MATTYLSARAGAVYAIAEGTPGTYVAPTQGSDKALRVVSIDVTLAGVGGPQRIEEDEQPYGGGSLPILDGIAVNIALVLRVPAWPGTQPHASADLPSLYALLASCPMTATTSDAIVWSPTSTFVAGTSPVPISLTYLENGGNVYAFRGCVSAIDEIRTTDTGIEMAVTVLGLVQATIADTVRTLAAASLTIADVAYTTSDNAWILSRGGTLTLTGLTGSGSYALRSAVHVPGQVVEHQADRLFPHGYGIPRNGHSGNSSMVLTITALDAAAFAVEDDMLAQTACTAATLSWGSGASAFRVALGSNNRILNVTRGIDAGVRTFEVELVGAPSAIGNDQYSIRWGTP